MRNLTLLIIPDILFQIVRDKLLDLGRLESPSRDLLLEQDVEFSVRSAPAPVSLLSSIPMPGLTHLVSGNLSKQYRKDKVAVPA